MPSTTTVVDVENSLVALLTAQLATAGRDGGQVQVSYAWPGADTDDESVFLGQHPLFGDTIQSSVRATVEIPTIKAGRKQRSESYRLDVTVWVFRPDLAAASAQTAAERAKTIVGEVENVFADNPDLDVAGVTVSHVVGWERTLYPFQSGWACVWVVTAQVDARLS